MIISSALLRLFCSNFYQRQIWAGALRLPLL
nr:MAG TPA: hypothetical protein [Caudoviricetes sp.]DAQ57291.1 MAG TPA: hypothetical protein [Bacteriophage sp.]